jgi:hypothetical protein
MPYGNQNLPHKGLQAPKMTRSSSTPWESAGARRASASACLVRVTMGSVGARSGARAAAVAVRRRRSSTLRREKRRGRGDGAMPVRRQRPWTVVPLIGRVRHRCGKKCNDTTGVLATIPFSPLASTRDFAYGDWVCCWEQSDASCSLPKDN